MMICNSLALMVVATASKGKTYNILSDAGIQLNARFDPLVDREVQTVIGEAGLTPDHLWVL